MPHKMLNSIVISDKNFYSIKQVFILKYDKYNMVHYIYIFRYIYFNAFEYFDIYYLNI